jgi:aspartokinase/homoserine dehydrogenase 1
MARSVFVVGATGNVGNAFVAQTLAQGNSVKIPTKIVGVASSKSFMYDPSGLDGKTLTAFAKKMIPGTAYNGLPDLQTMLRDIKEPVSVIDVTASPDMLGVHLFLIKNTNHNVVTANKQPLVASSVAEFRQLTEDKTRYEYSCSVMAGAGSVRFVRDLRDLGEIPEKIYGCFSGTLGYIATALENGNKFSDAVQEAMKRGYTEPNPAVDLSGKDVAYKILILTRSAGADVNMSDIQLKPFVPLTDQQSQDVNALIAGLPGMDATLKAGMDSAKADGGTLRYVARATFVNGVPAMSVSLETVGRLDPLGQLSGTANKIVVMTGPYGFNGNKPYVIEAPGAGNDITARNVRRDLLMIRL